jgi:hypothetical protein
LFSLLDGVDSEFDSSCFLSSSFFKSRCKRQEMSRTS